MARWADFERDAPDLARIAARLWSGITHLAQMTPDDSISTEPVFSIAYLATTRDDGSPRLHPFCPILAAGRLFAAIPRSSPKGHDLRRDGRCVIHATPGPDDDELCIRACAHEVTDDRVRGLVVDVVSRSDVGGMIESTIRDPIFEFDLTQVDVAWWLNVGQPGTRAVRHRWHASESPGAGSQD